MNIIDIWTKVDNNQNQKNVIIKADVVHAVHCVRLSRPQLVPTLQEYSLIYRVLAASLPETVEIQ